MVESFTVFVDQYLIVYMLKNCFSPLMRTFSFSELILKVFILIHMQNNITVFSYLGNPFTISYILTCSTLPVK